MKIQIINGPNLNLLGIREPTIYGAEGFDTYITKLRELYSILEIEYYQSNVEGELINKLHEVGFSYDGIIMNADAHIHCFTHVLNWAAQDSLKEISDPFKNLRDGIKFLRLSAVNMDALKTLCKDSGIDFV